MSSFRVRYQTLEFGDVDIHVRTLRDNQQFSDRAGEAQALGISSASWPLFGVIWPSGEVLARHVYNLDIAGKRILEVGCGIGLASLALNQRGADITATDYHPEAGRFLARNVTLNDGRFIPFVRTGWADEKTDLGEFDLIIGSDLLYEQEHVVLLAEFINQHASPCCTVIVVDPGRGQQGRFIRNMHELGFLHSAVKPETGDYLDAGYKGRIHYYQRH